MFASTDETWFTSGAKRSVGGKGGERSDGDRILVEGGVGAIDAFDSFVASGGLAP